MHQENTRLFRVYGIVTDAKHNVVPNLIVRAFDRDLRSEQLLGEGKTNAEGHYTIMYTAEQFRRAEKKHADLAIKVMARDGKQVLYATAMDGIVFNAPEEVEKNIVLPTTIAPELNEFDALNRALAPLLENVSVGDLREDDTMQDITFLQRETGVERVKIEHLVVAFRLAKLSSIDAAFFYALLRKDTLLRLDLAQALHARLSIDVHTDTLPLLYDAALTEQKVLERDVQRAIAEVLIPEHIGKELPRIYKQLAQFREKAEHYQQQEHPRKVLSLLSDFILSNKLGSLQEALEKSKYNYGQFLDTLSRGSFFVSDASEQKARTTAALTDVLGFNESIIKGIMDAKKLKKPEDIQKLAKMNRAEWKETLTVSAGKLHLGGKKIDRKLIDYHASSLVRTMEKRFPTIAFSAQMQREKTSALQHHESIATLFAEHDDFDIETTNIDVFVKEKELHSIDDGVRNEFKSAQRVFRLIPHYGKSMALLRHNIHSAQSIVAAGKSRFVNTIAPKAGIEAKEAREIFQRAEHKHTAAMLIVGELQDTVRSMDIEALKMSSLSAKLQAVSADFPNMKSLFNGVDLCACEHCRSVYSPAAYLVELLQFLDKRGVIDLTTVPPTAGRLAKDVLFERRPDIGDLDLSCENANTPLPYIDLVCELLEEAVAPNAGIAYQGALVPGNAAPAALVAKLVTAGIPVTDKALLFDADVNGNLILRDDNAVCKIANNGGNNWTVYRLRQTHRSAAELSAAPEYVNPEAYRELAQKAYAFALPFDLHHTEATAYFSRFGIERSQLMRDFQVGGVPTAVSAAAEKLELTDEERKLIVTPDAANQQLYWNTTAPLSAVDTMKVVATMLDKTGLSYKELQGLLALSFINPNGTLFIKHLDNTCDTAHKEIANLDANALDRIHRFLRLAKKTGWQPDVLNEVIMQPQLGNTALDNPCLVVMAAMVEVKEHTGIKLEHLVGFYGAMPHSTTTFSGKPSLYHSVFLNKAANGFIDEELSPEYIDGAKALADYKTTLSLCLQISEQDFDAITATFGNTSLTFANISRLYATTRLAKKLKFAYSDFFLFAELTTIDVFSNPSATLAFVQRAAKARTSPVKIADVGFLLRHQASNLDERVLRDDTIISILTELQTAYQKAFANTRSPFDAALTADELKDPLKKLLSTLPNVTEDVASGFMDMVDRKWTTPPRPAAAAFIDMYLGVVGSTVAIKNSQNALATAVPPNPDYDFESERKAFIQTLLTALSAYFYRQQKDAALVQTIAKALKTEENTVRAVLAHAKLAQPAPGTALLVDTLANDTLIDAANTPPVPPVINEAAFPAQFRALRLLHKLFPLLGTLRLATEEIEWMLRNNTALGWMALDAIPYEAGQTAVSYATWETLVNVLALSQQFTPVPNPADAEHPIAFFSVVEMLLDAATTRGQWLDALSLLTGYDRQHLDELDQYFSYSAPNLSAYRNPATWIHIGTCMEHLRTMGARVEHVKEYIKAALTTDDTQQLRMALKARYDETLWLDTLKEIMDSIRPQKRDALVAYLLATNPTMKSANDLFDYFLVDVEMEACMPSSRIVQAHGSIQLFAQRCLLGVEPQAAADASGDKSWEQWKWMKNYRVWEANRKVFLYPENWIEPELLTDKSSLFRELENELMQNEVNEVTTEDALIRYVEKLDDIAFLEVVATYYQTDIYTMHVFARTKGGDPAIYYYRRFEQERYWTPWEKVDLDITSDHLLAFVRRNRVHLAWPVFTEEPNPDHKTTVPPLSNSSSTQNMQKVERKLKIQIALSQFANKKWKPKKVSQDAIKTPNTYTSEEIPREKFKFFYNERAQQIVVFNTVYEKQQVYHGEFPTEELVAQEVLAGAFDIAGCKGYPELAPAKDFTLDFLPKFKDTALLVQRYKEQDADSTDDLSVLNAIQFFAPLQLLGKTPGTFRLTYPHQFTVIDALALLYQILIRYFVGSFDAVGRRLKLPMGTLLPYFFEDSAHAYVLIPGFYGTSQPPIGTNNNGSVQVRRTASDVLKFIGDVMALYTKYMKKLQDDPNHDLEALLQQLIIDPEFQRIVNELGVYATLRYGEQFKNMYHPLMCVLRTALYKDGVPALMKRETQLFQNPNFDFVNNYAANTAVIPAAYPVENLDFASDGSYSGYNWELFYHVPMLLATRLTANQKFEEALTWFHYMFNPTGTLEGTAPQKYWVTKPFYLTQDSDYIAQRIDTLLYKIADATTPERKELEFAIDQWRTKPFTPHTIARFRPVAYQKTLLMKYIDNLVEWGDHLFRQDTMESIAQATQMYILADKLLGPKPRIVPPAVKTPYQTYNQIEAKLDAFGNALVDMENIIPDLSVLPHEGEELPPPPMTLSSLYFCIPQNDKMLGYWDRIADRLFKIRNCQNIDGVERTLALFAPPIDPGMLVRAAAAGLDISSVLAGLNAPTPYYRFNVLAQKASELIQEVRGLGSALLQALEKKDAEALALLRSKLEIQVLNAVRDVKKQQIDEAKQQIEVLNKTKKVTEERHKYYANIKRIIPNEQLNLDKLAEAHDFQNDAQIVQATGAILGLIPDFSLGGHGAGGSPAVHATFGGSFLAEAANAAASVLNVFAGMASYEANRASILGGYERRFDDWKLQERLADKELKQIDQQVEAAKIRLSIAETDLRNHDLQIENAEKTDEFMRSKFTNKELYDWMIGQISSVYFRAYQLAYDTAKKAERCYQHELGSSDTFLQFGYWDSLKKGLQSADHLFHDLKRMETRYLDANKREYELTKHVSLALLDPLALVRLKATGSCDFEIPEAVFDMDHPGHYFRRIKSVSITLPCIAGPYTSVSAKLSLVSNKYRKNTANTQGAGSPKEKYEEVLGNDDRFAYNIGSIQSIATSSSQNDSGLFELNFRDERYLPFEGAGAVSTWRLELPYPVAQFDYNTISDALLHIKYTAREGGSTLRSLAEGTVVEKMAEIKQQLNKTGMHIAFNVKHDMPNEWHMLMQNGTVNLRIGKTRLPYFVQALDVALDKVTIIAKVKGNPAALAVALNGAPLSLNKKDAWKLNLNDTNAIALDTPFALAIQQAQLANVEELMIVAKYTITAP